MTVYGGFCRSSGEELRTAEPMSSCCGSCIDRSRGGSVASEGTSHVFIGHDPVKKSCDKSSMLNSSTFREDLK